MAKCIVCKGQEAIKIKIENEFTLCRKCYEKERRKGQQLSLKDDMQLLVEEIKEYDFYVDGSEGKSTKITTTTKGTRTTEDKVNISFLTDKGLKLLSGGHIRRQMITKTDLFNDLGNDATLFNYASLIIRCANKNNQVVDPKFLDSGVEALKQDGAEILANKKALKLYLGFKGKNDRTFNNVIKTLQEKGVIKIDGAGVIHVNPLYSNYSAIISLHSFILFKDSLKKKLYKEQYREVVADMFFRYIFTPKAKEYILKGYVLAAKRELENYAEYYKNTYGADFVRLIDNMFMVNLEKEIDAEEARILGIKLKGKTIYQQVMIRLGLMDADEDISIEITKEDEEEISKCFESTSNNEATPVTTIKTERKVVVVNGKVLPVPTNMPEVLPKVNYNTINDFPSPKTVVNDFGFEEEDTYSYL